MAESTGEPNSSTSQDQEMDLQYGPEDLELLESVCLSNFVNIVALAAKTNQNARFICRFGPHDALSTVWATVNSSRIWISLNDQDQECIKAEDKEKNKQEIWNWLHSHGVQEQ